MYINIHIYTYINKNKQTYIYTHMPMGPDVFVEEPKMYQFLRAFPALKHTHYKRMVHQRYPILKDYSLDIRNGHDGDINPLEYKLLFGEISN